MESENRESSEAITNLKNWETVTRVERLGELLVRVNAIKLSQLTELIQEQSENPGKKLGELAVTKGYITQDELVEYLLQQIRENQVVDESLKELGQMTREEKWERLSRHERLGEVLLKRQVVKLSQLVDAIETQQEHPNKHLGEVLIEKGVISEDELMEALDFQNQQEEAINMSLDEIRTTSDKHESSED